MLFYDRMFSMFGSELMQVFALRFARYFLVLGTRTLNTKSWALEVEPYLLFMRTVSQQC